MLVSLLSICINGVIKDLFHMRRPQMYLAPSAFSLHNDTYPCDVSANSSVRAASVLGKQGYSAISSRWQRQ